MPTRRGWGVIVLGLALMAVGRVLAVRETFEIGAALILLWLLATISLLSQRPTLTVVREPSTTRLHLGESVEVTVKVRNDGVGRAPALFFEEKLPDGTVTLSVGAVRAGKSGTASYEVTPYKRGRFVLGPGKAHIEDTFHIAKRTFRKVPSAELLVYPTKHQLGSRRNVAEAVAHGIVRAPAPASAGAEFFTIREHQHGDDLRKVHWVSSARSRKLMIRQEEQHRNTSVTIVVEDSRDIYPTEAGAATFESCLSSAASLIDLFLRKSVSVDLRLKGSPGGAPGKGQDHRHRLMERLALAQLASASNPLEGVLAAITPRPDHVILITPAVGEESLIRVRRSINMLTVIIHSECDESVRLRLARAGIETVKALPSLAQAWDAPAHRTTTTPRRVSI